MNVWVLHEEHIIHTVWSTKALMLKYLYKEYPKTKYKYIYEKPTQGFCATLAIWEKADMEYPIIEAIQKRVIRNTKD